MGLSAVLLAGAAVLSGIDHQNTIVGCAYSVTMVTLKGLTRAFSSGTLRGAQVSDVPRLTRRLNTVFAKQVANQDLDPAAHYADIPPGCRLSSWIAVLVMFLLLAVVYTLTNLKARRFLYSLF